MRSLLSSLLSRLLILLCIIGWIQYIDHANSNRSGDLAAQDAKAFAARSSATQAAKSTETQLQPIATAAAESPHVIVPDATPPAGISEFTGSPSANREYEIAIAGRSRIRTQAGI